MTNIRFYEARKKEARTAHNEVMLFARKSKNGQDDIEQIIRSMSRLSVELSLGEKLSLGGKKEKCIFARYYAMVQWHKEAMPFYRVYPAFQKQLSALGEDILENTNTFDFDIDKSLEAIAIEFPISNEPIHLCGMVTTLKRDSGHTKTHPDFSMYTYFWYKENGATKHGSNFLHVVNPSTEGDSFRKSCLKIEDNINREMFSKTLQTYAAIIAIGNNPDLLQPISLSKDREKYEKTLDPKLIDKAKRRGVFGFDVGKIFEDEEQIEENMKRAGGTVAPHYRKSHLAWQPHGPGNSLRKLILKKGSHVNLDKAKKVPMGYYGVKENVAK